VALAKEALVDDVPTCKHGHPLTPDNIIWDVAGRSGKRYQRCRACKHQSVRDWRARNSPAPNRSMIVPRKAVAGPKAGQALALADDSYATRRLFGMLPRDLRDRLATIVLDDSIDRLQRRVIERAADKRAWSATSEDMAARLLVENLLAQTIDARSPGLSVVSLLGLIFGR